MVRWFGCAHAAASAKIRTHCRAANGPAEGFMVGCEAIKAAPTAARDVHMWRNHQLLYEGITAIGPWRVVATHPTAQFRAPQSS